jgi:hypothetical protein
MLKPRVLIMEVDGECRWMSDKATYDNIPRRMKQIKACIRRGSNIAEVQRLLEQAGFEVITTQETTQ